MSGSKYFDKICWIVIAAALVITILFMNGEALGLTVIHSDAEETTEEGSYFSNKDLDCGWDTASVTEVVMTGTSGTSTGNGASFCEGDLVITQGGYYSISGELTDGSIIINVSKKYKVYLQLNGVTINCSDDACIRVEKADKVFLTLAEDSSNVLTGGSEFSDSALKDGTDGVIFSHSDLSINGEGSLEITAGYGHGIAANDDLVITGGSIIIDSPEDAVHANDSFRLCNASLTLSAGDDAIHTDGELQISGGSLTITECCEGIEGESINIDDGTITVTSTDDGINGGDITINGGDITLLNETGMDADGIDSNGDLIINGGTLLISVTSEGMSSAIDYGSESGGICQINGGMVIACGSNGMLETMDASSGQVSILYSLDAKEEAGSQVTLTDADGNELLNYTVPFSYSAVLLSCQSLTIGETYNLSCGGNTVEVTPDSTAYSNINGMGMNSGMNAGGMSMNSGMDAGGMGMKAGPDMENTDGGSEGSTEMPQMDFPDNAGEMPDMTDLPDSADSSAVPRMPGQQDQNMQGQQNSADSSAVPRMPGQQDQNMQGQQGPQAPNGSSGTADASAMPQMPDMQNAQASSDSSDSSDSAVFPGFSDSSAPEGTAQIPEMTQTPDAAAMQEDTDSSEMPDMSQAGTGAPSDGSVNFSGQGWNEDSNYETSINWDTVLPLTLASVAVLIIGIAAAALFRRR